MLVLHHNKISVLHRNSFHGTKNLQALDLTDNDLILVVDLPTQSSVLSWVESDAFIVCCLLPKVETCLPTSSAFSSCRNLLNVKIHRVLIYGQAMLTLVFNSLVFALQRSLPKREHDQMLHLTAGNMCMAFYLTIIAAVDTYYRNEFHLIAISWRYSVLCKVAAGLNMMAAEVSLFLLVYIAFFRAYSIQGLNTFISKQTTLTVCLGVWLTLTVYIAGLSILTSISDIPLDSNICTYTFYDSPQRSLTIQAHGFLFIALNLILVAALFVLYGSVAYRVRTSSAVMTRARAKSRQRAVALRLTTILAVSVLCWLPPLLGQLLSQFGVSLPAVPVWMAILVVPINASFCPLMFGLLPIIANIRKK